ncbi:MFS transporter [Sphingomonas koreensis]|jgi:predicted MFS family arabinose efflux permease|nr:MFS transporter [Sphingomonas koreensis]RSU65208.1 MFS transporter [Sphingomonas koreensis]
MPKSGSNWSVSMHHPSAPEPSRGQTLAEWRTGWALVVAACCGVALGSVQIYATGVFVAPLEAEFGWSRADISAALMAPALLGVVLSPLFGIFIDRWGARRMAIPGTIMVCATTASLSLAGPSIYSWWALWAVFGVATLFLKPTIWSTAVSSHFSAGRGLALAVMLSGTGLAQACLPTITRLLIDGMGWRGAYLALGTGFALVVVPVLWFFFHDARFERDGSGKKISDAVTGYTLREGVRTRQFWQLLLTAIIITGVIVGFVFHLVPLLSEMGLSRANATYAAGIAGIFSIIGRLGVGFMLDRLPGPPVGAISVALPIIAAALLLAFPGSVPMAIVAIAFLGLCIGGEYDSVIYLATRYFGMRSFGSLFGWITSALLAGVGLGPWIAGTIRDATGAYDLFLWIVIPLAGLSAVLLGTLGRYPEHGPAA